MKWWNELWLNEGFATYLQYKAMDKVFPEWEVVRENEQNIYQFRPLTLAVFCVHWLSVDGFPHGHFARCIDLGRNTSRPSNRPSGQHSKSNYRIIRCDHVLQRSIGHSHVGQLCGRRDVRQGGDKLFEQAQVRQCRHRGFAEPNRESRQHQRRQVSQRGNLITRISHSIAEHFGQTFQTHDGDMDPTKWIPCGEREEEFPDRISVDTNTFLLESGQRKPLDRRQHVSVSFVDFPISNRNE